MLAEFSIVPMDVGVSISKYIAKVMDIIDKSGLDYKVGPMGTTVEGEWKEVIHLIKDCHDAMKKETSRVYTRIAIDDRSDALTGRIEGKVAAVEKHLDRELKK
ncbi:MAG: MTH1187 family thiamine-binding protein [candidate division Zixibacteria bacterium]|nr:MTH1187 family thiamine-binding protein [candidate division Zixibacteria bacterium]